MWQVVHQKFHQFITVKSSQSIINFYNFLLFSKYVYIQYLLPFSYWLKIFKGKLFVIFTFKIINVNDQVLKQIYNKSFIKSRTYMTWNPKKEKTIQQIFHIPNFFTFVREKFHCTYTKKFKYQSTKQHKISISNKILLHIYLPLVF